MLGYGRTDRRAVACLLAFLAAYCAWQVARWGGAADRMLIGDLSIIPPTVAAMAAAALAVRRCAPAPKLRRSWRRIALGLAAFALGEALQAVEELILHRAASPSPADVAYLAFYPLLLSGLLSLPTVEPIGRQRLAIGVDLAMVLIAGAAAVWYVLLGPGALSGVHGLIRTGLAIAYPVADLLLVCALAHVLVRRARGIVHRPLTLLAAGVACFVGADLVWGWMQVHSLYVGGDWVDCPYVVAMVAFALAALSQRRPDAVAADDGSLRRERETGWPAQFAPLLLLGLIALADVDHAVRIDAILIGITAVVLLLSIARQSIARRALHDANRALADAHAEIEALAATDGLTGLPNRRTMVAVIDRELRRSERHDDECAALFIDLDHFKVLNDGRGHGAGDHVLRELSGVLRATVRGIDTVGRWGGEEFVAILPATGRDAALVCAERIRAAVAAATFLDGAGPRMTCSVGVAVHPADGRLREALLDAADRAMYAAKRDGRDRVRCAADAPRALV